MLNNENLIAIHSVFGDKAEKYISHLKAGEEVLAAMMYYHDINASGREALRDAGQTSSTPSM